MVLIVTLGHQCSIMSGHVFLWHSLSSNDHHKAPQGRLPSSRLLATSTAIYASPCLAVEFLVVVFRAGVLKLDIFFP